jgi:hypothetical protein
MELTPVLKKILPLALIAFTGCAPFQQSKGIPIPPYGDVWKVEIRDLQDKVILAEEFTRGFQFQRFSLAQPSSTQGSISTYLGDSIKGFRSGNLTLPSFNLLYAGDITELKSANLTGVAFFVDPNLNKYEKESLYLYPDNRKSIYDQIGCLFSKVKVDIKVLSGIAFLAEPAQNQLPIGSYMPVGFPQKGICTLTKLEIPASPS